MKRQAESDTPETLKMFLEDFGGEVSELSRLEVLRMYADWLEKNSKVLRAVELMRELTDEQRVEVIHKFCWGCGGPPMCHCMNDE